MRHAIIYAHPNPKSFSALICDRIRDLSEELGNAVTVRDLYKLNFNPVLSSQDFKSLQNGVTPKDIQEEQKIIKSADLITVIFPLWWTGYPAILKGWIDRVLLNGFAYQHSTKTGITPLLTDKKVQIITTMGASVEEYESSGLIDAMARTMFDNVWSFCGCDDAGMIVLGEAPGMSDKDRISVLGEMEETLIRTMANSKPNHKKTTTTQKNKRKPAPAKPKKTKTRAKRTRG
jgi:NAD(P)H dehydrogenase (quinone)